MNTELQPVHPQMRAITDAERQFLMTAWEILETQVERLKNGQRSESKEERLLTDDDIAEKERLIDSILWCFPEVRLSGDDETFQVEWFPERKKTSKERCKVPVWAVLRQIEQHFGKVWCQTVRENIAKGSA